MAANTIVTYTFEVNEGDPTKVDTVRTEVKGQMTDAKAMAAGTPTATINKLNSRLATLDFMLDDYQQSIDNLEQEKTELELHIGDITTQFNL